jgi:hypothetical protein
MRLRPVDDRIVARSRAMDRMIDNRIVTPCASPPNHQSAGACAKFSEHRLIVMNVTKVGCPGNRVQGPCLVGVMTGNALIENMFPLCPNCGLNSGHAPRSRSGLERTSMPASSIVTFGRSGR